MASSGRHQSAKYKRERSPVNDWHQRSRGLLGIRRKAWWERRAVCHTQTPWLDTDGPNGEDPKPRMPCKRYSQSRSRVNSISKNEMNIRISLCNVWRVNGMLDVSVEIVPKKTHWLKKRFKILGKQLLFLKHSILRCKEKFIALYRQQAGEIYTGTLKCRWRFSKLTCKFHNSVQISKISFMRDLGTLYVQWRSQEKMIVSWNKLKDSVQ